MKKQSILFFVISSFFMLANAQIVVYNYDESGNRIQREVKTVFMQKEEETEDRFDGRRITIYPNPTRQDIRLLIGEGEELINYICAYKSCIETYCIKIKSPRMGLQ